ncbi:MAG: branched-chain-amino-acid transaminase [Candidatus Acidiferrum sp.]
MIDHYVFHNDKLLPVEKTRLSPGQAGLICGWGVFTTLRISRGEAFAYERHWRRLEKDSGMIRLPLPCNAARARVHLHEVIRANKILEGCARIYMIYNKVGYWQGGEAQPQADLLITTAALPEYHPVARLGLREHGRHAASALAGVKSISWLNNVWMLAEAAKEGLDEVVLLNERGEVAECTSANIFVIKNGKIFTPPLNSGCLEGVTRGILVEIAPETGLSIVQQMLRPADLYEADEVFISSTNRNFVAVAEIGGRAIATGVITGRLNEMFSAYITDYVTRRLASAVR